MTRRDLRRVLERVAPAIRAHNATGAFTPSAFATPLSVASYALENRLLARGHGDVERGRAAARCGAALLGRVRTSSSGPAGTRTRSSASAPTTRRWRCEHCCAGASPTLTRRASSSPRRARSPRSSRRSRWPRRCERRGAANSTATSSSRRSRATGYRRESLVEHRAEFAVRGGIVDVWPAQGHEPIRLDFFGDEVERLTTFDIANQRSLRDLDRRPRGAGARVAAERARARRAPSVSVANEPWGRATFDRLATGQLFDGMEGWMPLFVDEPRTLARRGRRRHLASWSNPTACSVDSANCSMRSASSPTPSPRRGRRRREVPLLHRTWTTVLEDASTSRSDASLGRRAGARPDLAARRPGRPRAHRRARAPVVDRRVAAWSSPSNAAAVERMADQLRARGSRGDDRPRRRCSTCGSACSRVRCRRASASTTPRSWCGARATSRDDARCTARRARARATSTASSTTSRSAATWCTANTAWRGSRVPRRGPSTAPRATT